jgi:hypothetical protein
MVPAVRITPRSAYCRSLLRPPLAQHRVHLRADGRVLVELKTVWRDGPSHLLFEPIELLEKLAAITPRPAINLLLYHGVLCSLARAGRPLRPPRARPAGARGRRPPPAAPAPRAPGPGPP